MGFGVDLLDEKLHVATEAASWRESFFLEAFDPIREIGLVVYMHDRRNQLVGDLVTHVVRSGSLVASVERFSATVSHLPSGSGMKVGGLSFDTKRLGSKALLTYSDEHLAIDLDFDSIGPIYDYEWEAWTSSRHYEQFGRLTGTVEIDGDAIAFDGSATRDHAWGNRASVQWAGWSWLTARFDDEKAWGFCIMESDQKYLLGYGVAGQVEELQHATVEVDWGRSLISQARVKADLPNAQIDATLTPLGHVDMSGKDPTKPGQYLFAWVKVEDRLFGRGYGFLDLYSRIPRPARFEATR